MKVTFAYLLKYVEAARLKADANASVKDVDAYIAASLYYALQKLSSASEDAVDMADASETL